MITIGWVDKDPWRWSDTCRQWWGKAKKHVSMGVAKKNERKEKTSPIVPALTRTPQNPLHSE